MQVDTLPAPLAPHKYSIARKHPRAIFSVPITLHHLMAGGVAALHGISVDISEGGMGALVKGDLHEGETVEIDIQWPGHTLSLVAIVRHTSKIQAGFEFLGLRPEERVLIANASTG
jgi:c-di-GMP-binding flagellar brake protein YcgR